MEFATVSAVKAYGICVYKIVDNDVKILLCRAYDSLDKWGCLKGSKLTMESNKACAVREFVEESGIRDVKEYYLEEYFEQKNDKKDIGVWLINSKKIKNFNRYFYGDRVFDMHISYENSKVKLFSIKKLPKIKKKQKQLIKDITDFLRSKYQSR